LSAAEPDEQDHFRQLGSLLYRLGDLLIRLGDLPEAIGVLDEAESAYRALTSSIEVAVADLIADVRVRRARALAGVGRSASALVVADAAVAWYVACNGGVDPNVLAVAAATFGHQVNPSPVPAEYVVFDLARVLADQSEIVLACGDPDVALNAASAALHIYTANSRVVVALATPQQRTVAGQGLRKALRIARAITSAWGIGDERIIAASVLGAKFPRSEGDTADITPPRLQPPTADEIRRRVTFDAALATAGTAGESARELFVAWDAGDGPVTSSERCAPDDLDALGVALAALARDQRASGPAVALRLALEAHVALAAAARHRHADQIHPDTHTALAWARLLRDFSQTRAETGDLVLAVDLAGAMAEPIDALLPTVREEHDAMAVVVDCLTWQRHLLDLDGDESGVQEATRLLAQLDQAQPE
jgi:hypothetical protein